MSRKPRAPRAAMPPAARTGISWPSSKPEGHEIEWWCLQALVMAVPLATSNISWLRPILGQGASSGLTRDPVELIKFSIVAGLLFVAVGAWSWKVLTRGGVLRHTSAHWLVLGLVSWSLLTTLLSVDRSTAFLGHYTRYGGFVSFVLYALIFFLAEQLVTTPARRRVLARNFTLASGAVAAYGVLQYLGLDPASWDRLTFGLNRGFSTFGNPNFLGGFLVLALPIAVAVALTEPNRRWRVGYWISTLLIAAGWFTAFTRGAWLAGVVALAVTAFFAVRARIHITRIDWSFSLATIAALVALVARSSISSVAVTNVWQRIVSTLQFEGTSSKDRLLTWQSAWDAVRHRPIFGSGPDTFGYVFPTYKPANYVSEFGAAAGQDNAHSYPLQLAATTGVPGALLLYAAVGWVLVRTVPRRIRATEGLGTSAVSGDAQAYDLVSAGLWAACLGYIVHLFFGIPVIGSTVFLWLFLGVLITPHARTVTLRSPAWGRAAGIVVVAAACVLLSGVGLLLMADHYYLKALNTTQFEQRMAYSDRAVRLNPLMDAYRTDAGLQRLGELATRLKAAEELRKAGADPTPALAAAQSEFTRAERTLLDAAAHAPLEYDVYVALSTIYNWVSDFDPKYHEQAVLTARRGIEISPTGPAVRYQLALALANTGQLDEAQAQAEEAARLDPRFADPLILLGDLHRQAARIDEARSAYQAALARAPGNEKAQAGLDALTGGASGG